MIHYEWVAPEQAQPGDFMIEDNSNHRDYVDVYILVSNIDGNSWKLIQEFDCIDYPTEIIDGKPTPALIARFTEPTGKGKRFEVPGADLFYKDGTIFEVSHVRPDTGASRAYVFHITSDKLSNDEIFNAYYFDTIKQAEQERARLIEWLEEA